MLEEFKENPIRYIKSFAMDIVVVIVSVAYVFYQMVSLEPTELNPLVLIAEALMGIICGIIIKQSLGENGFSKGYNSDIWKKENDLYNNACNTAVDYTDRVDNFYIVLEREKKQSYRRNHLQAYRMKYKSFFDENGDYIGTQEQYKSLSFMQKWVLRKCIRVRIYVLNLFSEYAIASEQDTKKEMTDKRQRRKTMAKNTISATVVAIIGVYFVPMLNSWSWASFIAATMQVSLWVLFGILQLYTNFNFVVQDKVAILKRKKELISRFVKESEKGMYTALPYED